MSVSAAKRHILDRLGMLTPPRPPRDYTLALLTLIALYLLWITLGGAK